MPTPLKMYRGETTILTFGPFTKVGGGNPDSELVSVALKMEDNPDNPSQSATASTSDIDDAATWEGTVTLEAGDTSGLVVATAGTTFYYYLKLTAADGSIAYAPVDASGNPDVSTMTVYEHAH
jgi:hypothetical protein